MNFYEAVTEMQKGKKVKRTDTDKDIFEIRKFAGEDNIVDVNTGLPVLIGLKYFNAVWEVVL